MLPISIDHLVFYFNTKLDLTIMMMNTILYVEDDPDSVLVVESVLKQIPGLDLMVATTGKEGIQMALSKNPDLILLDINLPDTNGYEVLKELKQGLKLDQIPILAFTSLALLNERQRGIRAGFTDYLTKPMNMAEFLAVIKRYLFQHQAGAFSLESPAEGKGKQT